MNKTNYKGGDNIYTPEWVAKDIIDYFGPRGRVLDPALGDGAFYKYMPPGSLWCEIKKGRDFFKFNKKVNWIITNPPYSLLREYTRHAFKISKNIIWLCPVRNIFNSWYFILDIKKYGGIRAIRWYGPGGRLGFPMGNAMGAIYFKKEYQGGCSFSFCVKN